MLEGKEGGEVPVLLSGGGEAQLGSVVPEGTAPLAPVGDLAADLIGGAQANSSDGNLNALAPVLSPIILSVSGAGGEGEQRDFREREGGGVGDGGDGVPAVADGLRQPALRAAAVLRASIHAMAAATT